MVNIKVRFYTKGSFVKYPNLRYEGGDLFAVKGIDLHKWSYFEARDHLEQQDNNFDLASVNLWWMHEDGNLAEDIKPFKDQKDAMKMSKFAIDNKVYVFEIYVEPKASSLDLQGLISKGKNVAGADQGQSSKSLVVVDVDEDSEYETDSSDESVKDSSDESVKDVHFDDSEEERALDNDDWFAPLNHEVHRNATNHELQLVPVPETEPPQKYNPNNQKQKEKSIGRKTPVGDECQGDGGPSNGITPEQDMLHVIEDAYETDELDSASEVDTDGEGRRPMVKFNPDETMTENFKFKRGMEFSSLHQFKKAVLDHTALLGRQVKFVKNDANRCRVVCNKKNECRYLLLCSRVGRTTTFRVKTAKGKHDCGRGLDSKSAKASWVASIIVDRLKQNSNMRLNEIVAEVRTRFSIEIPACRAYKARQIARQIVEGDASKQYSLLWSYSAELKRVSLGNTCKLEIDRPGPELQPRFGRYYVCFDGCKKAIRNACRPFIGLDGCHLKNKYGGILLIAVGRDPNDQYLPLAFAVVETESKDSWSWFMNLLLEDIGERRWCFISDQQKGLINVFQEMLSGTEHRFCVRHLYANFKKKFGGGTLLRDLMMGAAKATYYEAWEDKMEQIKQENAAAYDWLKLIPTKQWCKHAFPFYSRCDVIMNNLSESFNATILLQRDKPILTMIEWIRKYLMERFATLREKINDYRGMIMPKPLRRLDKEIEKSGLWLATPAGKRKFQVTHMMLGENFIVDLVNHSCTCNFWDLVGIPCRHAVAAIARTCENPQNFVHKYYHKETYINCYDESISAINGQRRWPKTDHPDILPPNYKRGPGRPKKMRRRDPDEGSQYHWKRHDTKGHCGRCQQPGHNKRSCKLPDPKGGKDKVTNDGPATNEVVVTNDGGSHLQTQGSQAESAPKKVGKPDGSKNAKDPKVVKAPKATKAPKAPKATKANVPLDNVAVDNVRADNVLVDHVPVDAHNDVLDPDMLSKILFDDEVPDMISERLHCSAPLLSKPIMSSPIVPAVSDTTNGKKRKKISENVKDAKKAKD